jgi:hypothetical protein
VLISFDPYGYRGGVHGEFSIPVFVDPDLFGPDAKVVDKGLAGVTPADLHRLEPFIAVAKQDGAAGAGVFVISLPGPADAIGVIKKIALNAVGEAFPGLQKLFDMGYC